MAATAKKIQDNEERVEQGGGAPPPSPGSMEIELENEDDEEGGDGEEEAEGDDAEEEPSRAQPVEQGRRKQKRRERNQGYKQLEEQLARERESRLQMERHMAQLTGFVQAQHRPQDQQDPTAAIQGELDTVFEEQQQIYQQATAAGSNLTTEQYKNLQKRANQLEVKKFGLMRRLDEVQSSRHAPDQGAVIQQQVMQAQLNSRFPDFVGPQRQREAQYGWMVAQQMALEAGTPLSWEILEEAAERTRQKFGMPSKRGAAPPPTRTEQRRLEGSPSGDRGGGGGGTKSSTVRLSKEQIAMAKAAFPDLARKDLKKACQKWWTDFGKKHS